MIGSAVPVHIKVFANRIVVQRLDTKKSLDKTSEIPFSNDRLIIADYEQATKLMVQMIKELFADRMFFMPTPSFDICIQQISSFEGPSTPLENRILLDMAERCEADIVVVSESQTELSAEEVKKLLDEAI